MYSHIPLIIPDSAIAAPLSAASVAMAKGLVARLNAAYPVFDGAWRVAVNEQGGTIEVTNLLLSGKWGFLMHTARLDPEGRKIVQYAGELLERYRISRGGLPSRVLDELNSAPRNFSGELVADRG